MTEASKIYYFTLALTLISLFLVLHLGLLPALLAGLLVYHLVEMGARFLVTLGFIPSTGRMILLLLFVLIFVSVFAIALSTLASQISNGPESVVGLFQRMADVVESARIYLPVWAQQYLPANIDEWQETVSGWLRDNAREFGAIGREVGLFLIHIIIGGIIGGMVALNPGFQEIRGPFALAMNERVEFIGNAFRRIVFSQVRISALNTFLTAFFLTIALPLMGSALPLTKTLIVVTFLAGLLPIIGNLISNTVIFLIALSVSPLAAVGSILFLIILHKLEYFVNAHIIGTQIRARAWELLAAMLVMESAFGITGLVAAPIYYAYIKDELSSKRLI